jgi:hypothetical protein
MLDIGSKIRVKQDARDKYKPYTNKFDGLEIAWISFNGGVVQTLFPIVRLHIDDIEEDTMNTQALLDKLTKAISYTYQDDKTAPGLTVSALKKGYYCSVVRYDGAFGAGKVVICKAKADTLDAAIQDVAKQFLSLSPAAKNPVQELGELVGGK